MKRKTDYLLIKTARKSLYSVLDSSVVVVVIAILVALLSSCLVSGDENLVKSGGPGQPSIQVVDNDMEEVSNFEQDDFSAMVAEEKLINEPIRTDWRSLATKANQLVPPYAEIEPEYKRVCIYPNWSILRESEMAKIYPEDLDANLCTHIHYAYANIDVRTFQLTPSQYQDFNRGEHGAVSLPFPLTSLSIVQDLMGSIRSAIVRENTEASTNVTLFGPASLNPSYINAPKKLNHFNAIG